MNGAALSLSSCFVLGMLLASPDELQAQAAPDANHFKCYATEGIQVPSPSVSLLDQFDPKGTEPKETKIFKAVRFCNPVAKTTADGVVTPIVDPFLHMTLYLMAPPDLAPRRLVVVRNQFGQQRLNTYSPIILAVPTQKNTEPPSDNNDHYQCYSASGRSVKRSLAQVLLEDQFIKAPARVLRPRLFCNPVVKRHDEVITPVQNHDNHLVCYTMETADFSTEALITNQFEQAQLLNLAKPDLLCVPTEKLKFKVVK